MRFGRRGCGAGIRVRMSCSPGRARAEFLRWPEYREITGRAGDDAGDARPELVEGVMIDPAALPMHRRQFVEWLRDLLTTMQTRPPVLRLLWNARVGDGIPTDAGTGAPQCVAAAFSSGRTGAHCRAGADLLHAFRRVSFFHRSGPAVEPAPARPRDGRATRAGRLPACEYGSLQMVLQTRRRLRPAELIADCFELARDIRETDMRASPYDLRALGFTPIAIETPSKAARSTNRTNGPSPCAANRSGPGSSPCANGCWHEVILFSGEWLATGTVPLVVFPGMICRACDNTQRFRIFSAKEMMLRLAAFVRLRGNVSTAARSRS